MTARQLVTTAWDAREAELGPELARRIMVQVLDRRWSEHLTALADLQAALWREPTRGDPLDSYQHRAADLFADLQYRIHRDTLGYCLQVRPEQVES